MASITTCLWQKQRCLSRVLLWGDREQVVQSLQTPCSAKWCVNKEADGRKQWSTKALPHILILAHMLGAPAAQHEDPRGCGGPSIAARLCVSCTTPCPALPWHQRAISHLVPCYVLGRDPHTERKSGENSSCHFNTHLHKRKASMRMVMHLYISNYFVGFLLSYLTVVSHIILFFTYQ